MPRRSLKSPVPVVPKALLAAFVYFKKLAYSFSFLSPLLPSSPSSLLPPFLPSSFSFFSKRIYLFITKNTGFYYSHH